MPSVRVELIPGPAPDRDLPRGWPRDPGRWTGVAIDVLRATTTLTVALDHGARRIVPLERPADALALRERGSGVLACGEREGQRLPGFDLGNSPFEYTAARVAGRTLAFASTNGSLALRALEGCGTRWLAAFVNATAVAEELSAHRFVRIVCAGNLGGFALEDVACAGWLCARLEARGAVLEGAATRLARALAPGDASAVRALVQGCAHGRGLRGIGPEFSRDVEFCGALDALPRAFKL